MIAGVFAGTETGTLAGRAIDAIQGSSTAATGDETETVLHAVVLVTVRMTLIDSGELRCRGVFSPIITETDGAEFLVSVWCPLWTSRLPNRYCTHSW